MGHLLGDGRLDAGHIGAGVCNQSALRSGIRRRGVRAHGGSGAQAAVIASTTPTTCKCSRCNKEQKRTFIYGFQTKNLKFLKDDGLYVGGFLRGKRSFKSFLNVY
jgi:hypothetical protein